MTHLNIFESLPVRIKNSALAKAFLQDQVPVPMHRNLALTPASMLEKNLEVLADCLEDHGQEQYKWGKYQQQSLRQQQYQQQQLAKRVCVVYV